MDLNSILNTGVDPSTGKYLTPEERKEAFKRAMGTASTTKRGPARSFIKPGSALVKRDKLVEDRVKKESALVNLQEDKLGDKLNLLTKLANNLFEMRSERVRLETKYAETKKKVEEREKRKSEEQSMEASGKNFGSKFLDKVQNKAAKAAGFGLFSLLKGILAYGILDWISKPENKEAVMMMVKGLMGIFKVFSFFVETAVGSTLGGFTKLFGGGSILERIFGFFEMLFGIFLFRRILNPLKLLGDLKWVIKNFKNFKNLFKGISSKNLGKVVDSVKSIFPKAASIFKKGLQGAFQRVFLQVFGKGITKFVKPIAKKVVTVVVRPLANVIKRVPIVGTLLGIPINMFLGDPIDKAVVKSIGATLGAFVVGALGSIVPGAGTVLGGIAGGLLGDWLAGWLYDGVIAPLGKNIQKAMPQLNTGGIASGPDEGYKVTLHGTEAVIPIDKFAETALSPYKLVASTIIGGTLAVLKSMGQVGQLVTPIALQMFSPYIKLFGVEVQTFSSGLGRTAGTTIGNMFMSPAGAKEFPDVPASKEEMVKRTSEGRKKGTKKDDDKTPPPPTKTEGGKWGPVLDLIAREESGGNFESMAPGTTLPGATKMTIAQVARRATGAVGKWQNLPEYLNNRARAVGLDPNKDLYNEENQRKIAEYLIGPGQGGVSVDLAKKDPKKAMFKLSRVWAAIPKDDSGVSYYAGVGNNKAHIKPKEMYDAFQRMSEGGKFDQRKYEKFQKMRFQKDKKSSGDGRPPSKFATGGKAILEGAKQIVGMGRGQSNMCAATTRAALAAAKHPASEKRTQKGDLDSKGTAYNGRNFAASFAGSDMGTVIRSASALAAGDIVLWKGGNGYGSGEITHVGIKGDGNDLWHHGSGPGWRKASMYTSSGGQTFAAGIRLDGTPGTTESSPDSAPETGDDSKDEPKKDAGFMGSGVNTADLIYLMKNLGVSVSSSPAPTPSAPPASSSLPSMSKNFTLDKRISSIVPQSSETVIIQQGSNTYSNIMTAPLAINNFGVSTTDVLNKL